MRMLKPYVCPPSVFQGAYPYPRYDTCGTGMTYRSLRFRVRIYHRTHKSYGTLMPEVSTGLVPCVPDRPTVDACGLFMSYPMFLHFVFCIFCFVFFLVLYIVFWVRANPNSKFFFSREYGIFYVCCCEVSLKYLESMYAAKTGRALSDVPGTEAYRTHRSSAWVRTNEWCTRICARTQFFSSGISVR